MNKNTKEYIKFLEDKLSKYENNISNDLDLKSILKMQEEIIQNKIFDRDALLSENKKLWNENTRLTQTIIVNNLYINYLFNSFWWKLSYPLRKINRYIKSKKTKKVNYLNNKPDVIKDKVSVIIFSYNNDSITNLLIDNINSQKHVNDIEILLVTRNNKDKSFVKKDNIKYINLKDTSITNDEAYIKVLPYIDGKYIAIIDQNIIVNTKDWLYKSLVPIINNDAMATLFFDKNIKFIKETYVYPDLKQRLYNIDNNNVLFLPNNRDLIQFISPIFLENTKIIVKKRINNYYML